MFGIKNKKIKESKIKSFNNFSLLDISLKNGTIVYNPTIANKYHKW